MMKAPENDPASIPSRQLFSLLFSFLAKKVQEFLISKLKIAFFRISSLQQPKEKQNN
jgi:hypothetical protein